MNCRDSQEHFIDYLEGNLDSAIRTEVTNHLHTCKKCYEEIKELQQIVKAVELESDSIQVPFDFMNNVRKKVKTSQSIRRKLNKKHTLWGLVAALFLTIFVGTVAATNSFTSIIDWWKDLSSNQDKQIEGFVQHGLGEKLNLSAKSNGVKVTITNVVADDIQTFIYYEIEDQNKDNNYMINYSHGLKIANQDQNWDPEYSPVKNHLPLYSGSDHKFKGRLGIAPMSVKNGTIKLELSKLENVTKDGETGVPRGNTKFLTGKWRFDIPVKKHPAIAHNLDVKTEIDGNSVIFDKLTIAPTATVLSYRYRNENVDKRMVGITITSLESKGKKVYDQLLGGLSGSNENGWNSTEETFESLYFENPTDVKIHISNATYSVKDKVQFSIDKLPQTFEYLGTKILVKSIEPKKVMMNIELNEKRVFEVFEYEFLSRNGKGVTRRAIGNGYYIDQDGQQYKVSDQFYRKNELKNPRLFVTDFQVELSKFPAILEIDGYTYTTFYNKDIKLTLN